MRSTLRRLAGIALLSGAGLLVAAPVSAQGFGIGARMAWIRNDVDAEVDPIPCASSAAISGCRRSGLASKFPWIATRSSSTSSTRRSPRPRSRPHSSCAWRAAVSRPTSSVGPAGTSARSRSSRARTEREQHRIRLARRRRHRILSGPPLWHPRRLSLHVPGFRRRRRRGNRRGSAGESSAGCCQATRAPCGRWERRSTSEDVRILELLASSSPLPAPDMLGPFSAL